MTDYVKLSVANDMVQESLITQVLTDLGIPYQVQEPNIPTVLFGGSTTAAGIGWKEYRVPEDRLQEAKDNLCANGIVCDVSERLLKRTVAEIVEPLLSGEVKDHGRLLHAIGINNKETVRAIFEMTLSSEGGDALLEDVFFELADDSAGRLRDLGRALADESRPEFALRLADVATNGKREVRLSVLSVLAEFAPWGVPWSIISSGLLDADSEIRDAASEVLFDLEIDDQDYDANGPEDERREAVAAIENAPRIDTAVWL
jgi:hypothetical protein